MQSNDLFFLLDEIYKKDFDKNPFWWPEFGTWKIILSAILVQNTKFQNAQKALDNLEENGVKSLEDILKFDQNELSELIKPSGFYNQKAKRILSLIPNILEDFGDFENFKENVSQEWLILQKGIGFETCDSILCYACQREIMVCDNYSAKLLGFLGFEIESYEEMQDWLGGVDFDDIWKKYPNMNINEFYCRYHGLIVEFMKDHFNKGQFDDFAKEKLKTLM